MNAELAASVRAHRAHAAAIAETVATTAQWTVAESIAAAQLHATLAVLDLLIATTTTSCHCPAGMTYHAWNCAAWPAPGSIPPFPMTTQRPAGGNAYLSYPEETTP